MDGYEDLEKLLLKGIRVLIENAGDCLTPYRVTIQHHSAVVSVDDENLHAAIGAALEKMMDKHPTIASRLSPEILFNRPKMGKGED